MGVVPCRVFTWWNMRENELRTINEIVKELHKRGLPFNSAEIEDMLCAGLPHVDKNGESLTTIRAVLFFIREVV